MKRKKTHIISVTKINTYNLLTHNEITIMKNIKIYYSISYEKINQTESNNNKEEMTNGATM